ncbi:MAG: ornithine cyclodeaminase family protein [Rhodobacteraceae bacterium]|nr:ornithine cyclodeaminase family protein [Paracoccaceae bacterium]
MYYVSEDEVRGLLSHALAFDAVRDVFASVAAGEAINFPVIREELGHANAVYGFKSGLDLRTKTLGLKSGGYWPGNEARGLTNHQSTVLLFDPDTGRPSALLGGNAMTAYRTAASSANSIAELARKDSKVLGIVGAGFQSRFQIEAAVRQRDFTRIVGYNFHAEMLPNLAKVAQDLGLPFDAVTPQQLAEQSDVIITITSSFEPQIMAEWIQPGTHIACMGTDTTGKQEIDAKIFGKACVFADQITQSITIGEAQHAHSQGLLAIEEITPIGAVINGDRPGRKRDDDITVFDGTGIGLQDLAVATVIQELAQKQGIGRRFD